MRPLRAIALVLVQTTVACSGIEVTADYDESFDFESVETIGWMPVPPDTGDDIRVANNPLLDRRVRRAIESELNAKGLTFVDSDPDLYVNYGLRVKTKLDMRRVDSYYHDVYWYNRGYPDRSEWQTTEYEEGTLLIDFADAPDKQLVWRGWAVGRVQSNRTPEQVTQEVNKAVKEILDRFPPRGK